VHRVIPEGQKPKDFQIQHLVITPSGGAETKFNSVAQLQTIPCPKLFLNSNGLMALKLART